MPSVPCGGSPARTPSSTESFPWRRTTCSPRGPITATPAESYPRYSSRFSPLIKKGERLTATYVAHDAAHEPLLPRHSARRDGPNGHDGSGGATPHLGPKARETALLRRQRSVSSPTTLAAL